MGYHIFRAGGGVERIPLTLLQCCGEVIVILVVVVEKAAGRADLQAAAYVSYSGGCVTLLFFCVVMADS